ncbi:hypothetical protein AB0L13_46245 [Saccharopolyspora shandongensis]
MFAPDPSHDPFSVFLAYTVVLLLLALFVVHRMRETKDVELA